MKDRPLRAALVGGSVENPTQHRRTLLDLLNGALVEEPFEDEADEVVGRDALAAGDDKWNAQGRMHAKGKGKGKGKGKAGQGKGTSTTKDKVKGDASETLGEKRLGGSTWSFARAMIPRKLASVAPLIISFASWPTRLACSCC